jgi:signal transduction histidine kinase
MSGALVRQMRHDLRTPMAHIVGFSELLLEELAGGAGEALLGDLRRVQALGERLLELVDELFDQEAIEVGRVDAARLVAAAREPLEGVTAGAGQLRRQAASLQREDLLDDLEKISASCEHVRELMARVPRDYGAEREPLTGGAEGAGVHDPENVSECG